MSGKRFFVSRIFGGKAEITGEDFNHAVNVLRKKEGDAVTIFNREHGEFEGKILSVDSKNKTVLVGEMRLTAAPEAAAGKIRAIIALTKREAFELALEKLTEAGVSDIIPLVTKRCVIKLDDEEKKAQRWEKVIYAAVKQCGRLSAPKLHPVSSIAELKPPQASAKFFLWEKEGERSLLSEALLLERGADVWFAVGPEGGFEESEADEFVKMGFKPVSAGKNILRAETAAIIAAGLLSMATEKK